jgi:hypothetical protein
MNPQANQTSGLGLPQPSFEVGQASVSHAPESFRAPEASIPGFEAVPAPAQQPFAMPTIAQAIPPTAPAQQASPLMQPVPAQDAPAVQADDDSALDEEWVNKAREIVERTHNDPYVQSREISKIKSQYIKVRYNKDIKSSDDQP